MYQKILASLLFIFLFTTIFSMSGDGGQQPVKPEIKKEFVQEQNDQAPQEDKTEGSGLEEKSRGEKKIEKFILKNVWPDQDKSAQLSEEQYIQVRYDYFEKAKKMGENNRQVINEFWNHRINVNVLDKLKELGADPGTKDAEQLNYYDNAMFSQIVLIGTISDITVDKTHRAFCPYSHNVKIESILFGEEMLPSNISEIIIKRDKYQGKLLVGRKYCLFLTKFTLEDMARYNDGFKQKSEEIKKNKLQPLPVDVNEPNVFATVSALDLDAIEKTKETTVIENGVAKVNKKIDFIPIKENIKKIGKLNDKTNFYNRSYK